MTMRLPFAASTAAAIEVNGGAITTSQCAASPIMGRKAAKNARVSDCVLYIFQFPAITLRRFSLCPLLIGWLAPLRPAACFLLEIPATLRRPSKCEKSFLPRQTGGPLRRSLRRRRSKLLRHRLPLPRLWPLRVFPSQMRAFQIRPSVRSTRSSLLLQFPLRTPRPSLDQYPAPSDHLESSPRCPSLP